MVSALDRCGVRSVAVAASTASSSASVGIESDHSRPHVAGCDERRWLDACAETKRCRPRTGRSRRRCGLRCGTIDSHLKREACDMAVGANRIRANSSGRALQLKDLRRSTSPRAAPSRSPAGSSTANGRPMTAPAAAATTSSAASSSADAPTATSRPPQPSRTAMTTSTSEPRVQRRRNPAGAQPYWLNPGGKTVRALRDSITRREDSRPATAPSAPVRAHATSEKRHQQPCHQGEPMNRFVMRLSSFPKFAVLLRHLVACATML